MAYARIQHAGGAVNTTLNGAITSGATSLALLAATGWPDGATGPFYLVVDQGLATEEKILATSRTTTTLNTLTRGVDGTAAAAHASGASVIHCFTAIEADEANVAVNKTIGQVTTKGDLLAASASQTLARVAAGANNTLLHADSGGSAGLSYSKLATGDITAGAVDAAALASNAVTTVKITDANVTAAKLASDAVTTVKITDANVTAAKLASDAVTTAKILDANVTIAKFASGLQPVQVCTSATRPGSPTQGMTIYETDTGKHLEYQGATDTWTPPWNTAWGLVASPAVISTDIAHVQATTLAGFTTTFTEVANRWYRLEASLRINCSAASNAIEVLLKRTSTTVYRFDKSVGTDSPSTRTIDGAYTIASSAGSHAFSVFVDVSVGAGDLTLIGTTGPCQFAIYDVGPNGVPS